MTMIISPLDRLLLELLPERDRMRHGRLDLGHVELALPAAYDDGGDAVADEVRQRPALAHELVDAEQDGERLDRDVGHDRQRRRQREKPAPVTPDAPLDVIMATARMPSSWPMPSGVLVACARKSVASVI